MSSRGGVGRWLRTRLRHTTRIARWEVTKNAGGVDRRTVVVAVLALAAMGVMAPLAASQGVAIDEGIYRVGVDESSPYYEAAKLDPRFEVRDSSREAFANGKLDLLIYQDFRIDYQPSQKGRAAAAELRSTVERYNDAIMGQETNQSAAFPVVVNLTYEEQPGSLAIGSGQTLAEASRDRDDSTDNTDDTTGDGADTKSDTSGDGTDGTSDGDGTDGTTSGDGTDSGGSDGTTNGGATDGTDGTSGSDGDGTDGTSSGDGDDSDDPALGGSSFTARLTGGEVSGTPSDIAPPFPFRSLVLAFIFILPLNFVIQAYGSTILSERINRRGELLLVSPVSRGDIIVGKTLPYFAGSIAFATVIAIALGGSAVSVLAIVPLAGLFLAATFLGAMFARSFKELTFVTVTITVSLTSYAFVPAIFTDVIPIALISPLTLVVRDLQGQAIVLGEFLFSVVPPTLTALVMFLLGAGLYREEDMFTQRPIPHKVLDSLAGPIKRRASAAKMSALLIPFVLVTELVAIAVLFALGGLSIPLVLVVVAVVEEVGKSLHVYAGYTHARFEPGLRTALVVGAFSGLGFFLAEKLSLIARLTGLPGLPIGEAALNTGLVSGPLVIGFLFAPLALHVVTASISAIGASRNRRAYVVAITVAIAVHVAYNLTVVSLLVN